MTRSEALTRNEAVLAHQVARMRDEFAQDVDVLVAYGSHVTGHAAPGSDLDLFFIPATRRGREAGETFILEDVGYDLWGLSWQYAERIADLREPMAPLVGDGRVAWARTPAARRRYEALAGRLARSLASPPRRLAAARAGLVSARGALAVIEASGSLAEAREHAAFLIMDAARALTIAHGTHFARGVGDLRADLAALLGPGSAVPARVDGVLTASDLDAVRLRAGDLLAVVADHVETLVGARALPTGVPEPVVATAEEGEPDYALAASWYEEARSTFGKIERCVAGGDALTAFLAAAGLQRSLRCDTAVAWPDAWPLGAWNAGDLAALARRVRAIEASCVTLIEGNGGRIRRLTRADLAS